MNEFGLWRARERVCASGLSPWDRRPFPILGNGPFALGPPPVSDPRLRFGSLRGFQSPAFFARTPRRKISLISRAMVSAPGSTRGLYHVYSQLDRKGVA